ncbi:MAG: hemolysin family protein [Anaerolineales bacterium]
MWFDIAVITALIVANGFFAAAEMAMVAARRARLQTLADSGNKNAQNALKMQQNPADFLAAVQIGITLVGTTASAFGGAEVARTLIPYLQQSSWLAPYAEEIALTAVVALISYASLVFGELAPKRLALRDPEKLAILAVQPMRILSHAAALPMRLLNASANAALRLFGPPPENAASTSPEEIEMLVLQGAAEGVIDPHEANLIRRVFDFGERRAWDVMTPRTRVVALDAQLNPQQALQLARAHGFSRYPVYSDTVDNLIGYVHVKDVIWASEGQKLGECARPLVFLPGSVTLQQAFSSLTRAGRHLAVILDEFGGMDGLLTLEDLLEEIVGEIEDEHSPVGTPLAPEEQQAGLLDGATPIAEIADQFEITFDDDRRYTTLAGFVMTELGRIPSEGDRVEKFGRTFEVIEMQRLRVARIRIT